MPRRATRVGRHRTVIDARSNRRGSRTTERPQPTRIESRPAARNCRRRSVVWPCPASWLWQLARWREIASLVTPSFPGMFFFIALCSVIKLRANLLRVDVAVARPLAPSVVILLESAGCPPGHSSRVHACVFTGGFGFVWKPAALAVSAGGGNRWGKARFPFGTLARK